jgi:hypothetical protein
MRRDYEYPVASPAEGIAIALNTACHATDMRGESVGDHQDIHRLPLESVDMGISLMASQKLANRAPCI